MKWSRVLINIRNVRSSFPTFRLSIGNFFHILPTTWKPARFLPPSQVVPLLLAVEWYKKRGNNSIWDCSNKRFILDKNAGTFWEIQNKLTATDWKKKFHPVGFFIDFGFVSALEEWAGSGSAGSPLTRRLFRHLVNNTDTPKVTCERKKIMSEPRTSFSRRLSSVRLLFDMASTVSNGSDRSEKWYRPFTKWKLVPTLILKAFCLAAVTYCTRSFKGPFLPSMQRAPRPNFL